MLTQTSGGNEQLSVAAMNNCRCRTGPILDREDYAFLSKHEIEYAAGTADGLLTAMVDLDKSLSATRSHGSAIRFSPRQDLERRGGSAGV